jgi:putative transposase
MEPYYRRHLPHYQPEGETYHVVFRLAGTIPAAVFKELKEQQESEQKRIALVGDNGERRLQLREFRFKSFDCIERLLDTNNGGPFWLRKPEIAEIVGEAIRYRD